VGGQLAAGEEGVCQFLEKRERGENVAKERRGDKE